jgi:hypothetical protein
MDEVEQKELFVLDKLGTKSYRKNVNSILIDLKLKFNLKKGEDQRVLNLMEDKGLIGSTREDYHNLVFISEKGREHLTYLRELLCKEKDLEISIKQLKLSEQQTAIQKQQIDIQELQTAINLRQLRFNEGLFVATSILASGVVLDAALRFVKDQNVYVRNVAMSLALLSIAGIIAGTAYFVFKAQTLFGKEQNKGSSPRM